MCGIAGIVGTLDPRGDDLRAMLHALRHRGPDGEGVHVDGHAALGHRRLSIIDLEGGRQPLHNVEKTIWLVCNGEIYNYQDLRAELIADGHRFVTHSDCEVIIGLYERYGDALLDKLRGMFAFALWDSRKQRLLAARDHLGQKPFFYVDQKDRFAFGSEIKALLGLDPGLRQMNLQALEQYLALRLIGPPLTMFKGVHKLPPGHKLTLQRGASPRIEPYWDLSFEPKTQGSEDDLIDELDERITESLRLHMVSDVRVGAFLSGGLDSSLLVAMLSKRVGVKDLPTFTIGLPYQRFDEAPYARAVATQYGTEHHERTITPSLTAILPDLIYHLDEPSDPLSLCAYQVSSFAHETVKVVIGGDGGDELFGGYDRYYGNLYAGHYSRIPAPIRRSVLGPALSLVPASGWYKSAGHQMRWLHRLSFLSGGERYAASLSYFYFDGALRQRLLSPGVRAQLANFDPEMVLKAPFDALHGDHIDRMLYADSKVRLPDHPVMISDRMSMAHGLEARSPFMDHKLAEFTARLSSSMKVRGRTLRYIQRKLAARYLSPEILTRPKQGFSSALPYILRDEYRSLYDRYLRDSELVRAGVFEKKPLEALLAAHLAGHEDHGNRLWLLINTEVLVSHVDTRRSAARGSLMKIGIMLRHYEQQEGGVKVYTKKLLPLLLTMGSEHQYVFIYQNPKLIGTYASYPNVEEVAISMPGTVLWDQVGVPWIARKHRLDLVFNPKFTVPLLGNFKKIFVLHGSEWFVIPEHFRLYDQWYFKNAVPIYCRTADAFVAVSHAVKTDVVEHVGVAADKVVPIHNGFDPALFRRTHDAARLRAIRDKYQLPEKFILWVGQIESRKNVSRLLQAFAAIKNEVPHALVIAGEQRHTTTAELKVMAELGIADRVLFPGWILHTDLPAVYALADHFSFPSLYEGFGIPLIEAMACGCPIVTATTCAPPEVVDGAAVLVDPLDVQAIAAGMRQIIADAPLRQRLIARGLERAADFSWDKCATEVLALFKRLDHA